MSKQKGAYAHGSLPGMAELAGKMPDMTTEQTIREALDKATPGPWTVSILAPGYVITDYPLHDVITSVVEYKENGEIDSEFKNCVANRRLIANAPTWLEYLLGENERLKIALHTHKSYDKTVSEMQEENAAMREALEYYADGNNHIAKVTLLNDDLDPEEVFMGICVKLSGDSGKRARDLLASIGVGSG